MWQWWFRTSDDRNDWYQTPLEAKPAPQNGIAVFLPKTLPVGVVVAVVVAAAVAVAVVAAAAVAVAAAVVIVVE